MAEYRTFEAVGRKLGVSRQRATQILKRAGIELPLSEAEAAALAADMDTRRAMNNASADAATGTLADRLRSARLRLAAAQLGLLRLDNELVRGEWLHEATFRTATVRAIIACRTRLQMLCITAEPFHRNPSAAVARFVPELDDIQREFLDAWKKAIEAATQAAAATVEIRRQPTGTRRDRRTARRSQARRAR